MDTDVASPSDPTRWVLSIDIGATKIAVGLVGDDGRVASRAQAATPAGDGEAMWATIDDLVDTVRAGAPGVEPVAVGCGCGGPMTRGGATVTPLNIGGWRDEPLLDRLRDRHRLPTAVDNDAKALALAEGRWGAATGVDDYIAMVVSSGVGGGIVSGGRLLDGADGNAGHIGHLIVEPGGRRCACGARGCLEAEASGLSLQAMLGGPPADAPEAVKLRTGELVGRAVASVANLLDLRLAVVAGSVALGFGEPFFAAAQAELDRSARLSFSVGAVIRPGGLAADGPLLGACAVGLGALAATR